MVSPKLTKPLGLFTLLIPKLGAPTVLVTTDAVVDVLISVLVTEATLVMIVPLATSRSTVTTTVRVMLVFGLVRNCRDLMNIDIEGDELGARLIRQHHQLEVLNPRLLPRFT